MEPLLSSRVEIFLTLLIDSALLAASASVRAFFLWIIGGLLEHDQAGWPLKVLEFTLDFGLLGTVIAITVFDLFKRVRTAYRDFRT